MDYVSLHNHSTFSYGDGYGLPKAHVARVAELGGKALALTEHGNTSSHVQLEKAALAAGIKPIFGEELYTASERTRRKWHLTVLAEDETGYRNLMRLTTRAWSEGFYQWPTVSGTMLKEHSSGLIVLSGCSDSLLACDLLGGKGRPLHEDKPNYKLARTTAQRFAKLFGNDYYLEVQAFPELARTHAINQSYERLSKDLGIPLVVTCDVHYPMPEQNEMQKILHAALRDGKGTVESVEAKWEYDIRLTFPASDDVLLRRLTETGLTYAAAVSALENTALIAERATVTLPKAPPLRYPLGPGETAQELIWTWLREGWRYRLPRNPRMRKRQKEYVDRLKYEMAIVTEKDFVDYFLMLSDVVRYAKGVGIPVGPARGSAAASLACYLLRITEVDPLQFPMVFERFIDTTRADLPDVDLDFDDERRDEIRLYLISKYGEERVGNIGNFTRFRGKNSVNDVARVHQIPKWEAEIVNERIVERSGGDSRFDATLEDTIEMFPQVKAVFEKYPQLYAAVELEGNYRGLGVHAAGIVVATEPINNVTATYRRTVGKDKREVDVLAVDKYDAAYLGLLKADFLGLKTLGMIAEALRMTNMTLEDLYAIPLDDPETMSAFRRADVVGIFQYEGRATRLLCRSVAPDTFLQLADVNALSRPGPLFSGASNAYVEAKHGRAEIEHLHPIVDKYVGDTFGQIIYQEQVLNIIREMGGFPITKVGFIRRVISQKSGEQQFNTVFEDFVKGAWDLHGIDKELATKVWKLMVTSATYSFNIAHCISYSMIGFWCMWLKVHYPAEFYAAHLSKMDNDKDTRPKIARIIKDAARHGVVALGPDVTRLSFNWSVEPGGHTIRAGLIQIPGIGDKKAPEIIAGAPYESWSDLQRVKGIGPKKVAMIEKYANSDDPFGVLAPGRMLDKVRAAAYLGNTDGLLTPKYTSDEIAADSPQRLTWVGFVAERNYQDYVENQRSRTGEEIADIIARMDRPDLVTSCVLRCYDDGDEDVYLRFNRYSFPRFKAALAGLSVGDIVIIAGRKHSAGFGTSVAVDEMQVLDPEGWES